MSDSGKRARKSHIPLMWFYVPLLGSILLYMASNVMYQLALGRPTDRFPWWLNPQTVQYSAAAAAQLWADVSFRDGAEVPFWLGKKKGKSLDELDDVWTSTYSCWGALQTLKRGKAIRTSICTMVHTCANMVLVVLWARASYTDNTMVPFRGDVALHITPSIMTTNPFGVRVPLAHPVMTARTGMKAGQGIFLAEGVDEESWTVTAPAFGWLPVCKDSDSEAYDFNNATEGDAVTVFSIKIYENWGPEGFSLVVESIHKPETGRVGHFITRRCLLAPAIVLYTLHVTGSTTWYRNESVSYLNPTPLLSPPTIGHWTALPPPQLQSLTIAHDERFRFFASILDREFATKMVVVKGRGDWWTAGASWPNIDPLDFEAAGYAVRFPGQQQTSSDPRLMSFYSPMDNILNYLNELSLRTSIIAAIDSNITQLLPYAGRRQELQYLALTRISRACYIITNIAGAVTWVAILVLRWGFWALTEQPPMSPKRIAEAFAKEVILMMEMEAEERPADEAQAEEEVAGGAVAAEGQADGV
ncbi:hypothetical protein B0T20DRAFT_394018 [Sordaria brevicollis]|uniref:Uncharacterized protein n=1 Tax=Sordaria brevicollis TaxID=83679 RepID=A0AAE0PBE9_SORBR|nr:hypothetical protein B0T20DRAFT_394018 [Sordaria brevicollis]